MPPPKKTTKRSSRSHHSNPHHHRQHFAPPTPGYADPRDQEFNVEDERAPPPPPIGNAWSLSDYPPQATASASHTNSGFPPYENAYQQGGNSQPTYVPAGGLTESPEMYGDNDTVEEVSSTQARKGSNDSRQDPYPPAVSSYDRTSPQDKFDGQYCTGSQERSGANDNNMDMGWSSKARDPGAFMRDVPGSRSSTSAAATNTTQNPNWAPNPNYPNPNWGQLGDRRSSFQDFQKPFPSKTEAPSYPPIISESDSINCLRDSRGADSVPRSLPYTPSSGVGLGITMPYDDNEYRYHEEEYENDEYTYQPYLGGSKGGHKRRYK